MASDATFEGPAFALAFYLEFDAGVPHVAICAAGDAERRPMFDWTPAAGFRARAAADPYVLRALLQLFGRDFTERLAVAAVRFYVARTEGLSMRSDVGPANVEPVSWDDETHCGLGPVPPLTHASIGHDNDDDDDDDDDDASRECKP